MEQEILNLANKHIQLAISNALNCLIQKSNLPLRCRSLSINRKVPFHNTISRYSIPTTKNDFVHYQSRCQTLQNINCNGMNRIFDVQYSFSLNKPLVTKINKKNNLKNIQNFVNEFIENSIQTALFQVC
jgi:hypothetical protein